MNRIITNGKCDSTLPQFNGFVFLSLLHAVNCVRFCFSAVCDFCVCLFVNQISREPLNGFAPNSHGRRVWFLARKGLNVKVKGQSRQGQISSPLKKHCNALAADNVIQQQTVPFHRFRGVMGVHRQRGRSTIYVAACVRFMIVNIFSSSYFLFFPPSPNYTFLSFCFHLLSLQMLNLSIAVGYCVRLYKILEICFYTVSKKNKALQYCP